MLKPQNMTLSHMCPGPFTWHNTLFLMFSPCCDRNGHGSATRPEACEPVPQRGYDWHRCSRKRKWRQDKIRFDPRNGGHVSLTGLWDTQKGSSKRRLGEFTELTLPKKPGLYSRGARELLRVSRLHILKHRDWAAEGTVG